MSVKDINDRKVYLEILRIIAIFLVIFNHQGGYQLYSISSGVKHYFYEVITMITRMNVPVFFMISGTLLLGKDETYNKVCKRIVRFLTIIFLFEGIYCILVPTIRLALQGQKIDIDIAACMNNILSGKVGGLVSYWFLYAYVGFLIASPLLRKISNTISDKDIIWLMIIRFIVYSLWPMLNTFMKQNGFNTVPLHDYFRSCLAVEHIFFYPLVGYYMDRIIVENLSRRKWMIIYAACSICICIECLCTELEFLRDGKYTQNYVMMFDYVIAITAFITVKRLYIFLKPQMSTIICNGINLIGSLTFGMYLLDPFCRMFIGKQFDEMLLPIMRTLPTSVVWCFFSMIIGGLITFLIKKIPGIGKLI